MKKSVVLALCALFSLPLIVVPPAARASGSQASGNGAAFKDAAGKEWVLSELRTGGKTVKIDRKKLEADSMGGFFTLNFKGDASVYDGQASGVAAPNRYFGPYTAADDGALKFGNMASTMMMAFKEPEDLNERGYFDYLSKVTRWELRDGKLELQSSSGTTTTVLVFVTN